MQANKVLYRKYFPNSRISDSDLKLLLNSLKTAYPGKDIKSVFLEMQRDNVFWNYFKTKYPHAEISKFHLDNTDNVRNVYYGDHWAWGETKHDKTKHVFSKDEVAALGKMSTFPRELSPSNEKHPASGKRSTFPRELILSNEKYPIPGIKFNKSSDDIASELITMDIYVTPTDSFQVKMRNVFKMTVESYWRAKTAYAWLRGPNYNHWTQQLNFAVWCATCGCGISLVKSELARYPPIIQGFIKFHVYFTIRRILYELGVPLPDDTIFDRTENKYNKTAFESLCNEFGLKNPDFRWKGGRNHGLGDIFLYYSGQGYFNEHIDRSYDVAANTWPGGGNLFSDEGGSEKNGRLISFMRNDESKAQYSWFTPSSGHGLTRKGMGRINRSLEAFVYCVLGSQVNIRSSIVGNSGGAVEAQQEMMKLFESAVIEEDLSTSVQRYQLAVQEAKLRLDMAIAPGIWLMPSNLVINTESIVGYNNELQKATLDMKFGVNETVNEKNKKVGIKHNMGESKVKLPHVKPDVKKSPVVVKKSSKGKSPVVEVPQVESKHETNKSLYMIAAVGLGWYLF